MSLRITSPNTSARGGPTRQQLLESAGAVFAETGFRHATLREICARAGANIAAVNYHFGDKETLYSEVLHFAQTQAVEKYPPLLEVGQDAPADQRLNAFVRSLLLRLLDQGPVAWHGKLMAREMIEPTSALDALAKERIQPMAEQLRGIVAELLQCSPEQDLVRHCLLSVVSQCVFYHHCRPLLARIFPQQHFDAGSVEKLAAHIIRFSLAAMQNLTEPVSSYGCPQEFSVTEPIR